MSNTRFDVVGIGNAIVDIIGQCDDDFLVRHESPKGHMRLVDAGTVMRLYAEMGPGVESSGGSVANTMAGIASLGGRAGFIVPTGIATDDSTNMGAVSAAGTKCIVRIGMAIVG